MVVDENQKPALCGQLGTIDTSLFFIGVLTAATALSWKGTAVQREGLCRILRGEASEMPDVYPIRLTVSALVVGALVYFLLLAQENRRTAQEQGPVARHSADMNLWASAFVLAAALIRLYDLNFVRRCGENAQTLEEEELPD